MNQALTPQELEQELGASIRRLRLQRNVPQHALAAHAGVSLSALRHLESGMGTNLVTMIRVVRALDKESWLHSLAPVVSINPLYMGRGNGPRQRARQKRRDRA